MTRHGVPEGTGEGAGAAWPADDLVASLRRTVDFELRPGEHADLRDDEESRAAARRFRDVLGRFCSGVTVVTSMLDGEPVGMTCQSFASVSLDPPLVMFVPARSARAWPAMRAAGHFCVNLLSHQQQALSDVFASRGADKFDGVAWTPSSTGAPLLEGVVGFVDCTVEAVHEAGDHWVVIGRVRDLGAGGAAEPLLFFEGRYRSLGRAEPPGAAP